MGNSRKDRRYLISETGDEPLIYRLPNAADAAEFARLKPTFRVVKWQWIVARYPQIPPHDAKGEAIGAWKPDGWLSSDGTRKSCERYVPLGDRESLFKLPVKTWYAAYRDGGYVDVARFATFMDRETFCTALPGWRPCQWRDVARAIPGTFRYCRSSHAPFWKSTTGEFCGRKMDYATIRFGEDGRRCTLED